ncbi:multidrug efflux RND transporter permease subunit [Sphingobium sp. TKS]|uniref:multidrug efflux RND transporter permease subunit n=1 Tax=Sphingobium sp. TKS TaxID=1315974 RepID=UPI0007701520|nr:multidrug efflux RND transporter permease subunit [Sphingobium sp. TKS]AMK25591.1 hydrophobe/amphiphile efflux-1 (HAE1) family transporter [Sphingobium sp. TKS]
MNRFFVQHPVFACVIAAFVALAGAIALSKLPVEQYPSVAPPTLNIVVNYPGADADMLDRNVTSVIEKEMNGIGNLIYMNSVSRANGTAQIAITLASGSDLNIARSQIQDRLSRVEPRLPAQVRQQGVQVQEFNSGFLQMIALSSRSGRATDVELGNYASNTIVEELRRIKGVGDVTLFGSQYAMRIWLDPEKLAGFGISPGEALAAVREQNSQTPQGTLGDQPVRPGTEFQAKIVSQGGFSSPEQFREVIIRSQPNGATVRLGDVARVELGAENYGFKANLDGRPIAAIAIQMSNGANAVATARAIHRRMTELSGSFPPDYAWSIPFDTTPFINASIESVIHTLVEAMVLVFVVMYLFLQGWRATLIPAIVVPIAFLGACLGLYLAGFSINTLSLFAMVMGIGILVDDAIVVVENVDRIMAEEGLSAPWATVKAMEQISGAIIGITLVLVAVFIPMAFFPGSTGGIYRQFSITLAVSILFSALLALTLTPALCAILLRHSPPAEPAPSSPTAGSAVGSLLRRLFRGFNDRFSRGTQRYEVAVRRMLSRPLRWLAVFTLLVLMSALLFGRLPGGFLPTEDQGYIFVNYDAPPGATLQRTAASVRETEKFLASLPQTQAVVSVLGFNFFGQGQTAALSFVRLKPWEERSGSGDTADAVIGKVMGFVSEIPDASIFGLSPPPIPALGNATGFSMKLESRSGDRQGLLDVQNAILAEAGKSAALMGVRSEAQPEAPQLHVEIDRIQARSLGLSIADVDATLSIAFGSAYANDFTLNGNVLRVFLQADASHRMVATDVLGLRVRNIQGDMVPFSAFARVHWITAPQQLERYNGYPSLAISGQAAAGHASGEALDEMMRIAQRHVRGDQHYEWTGTAFEETQAGGQVAWLVLLSLMVVFFLLAALYESWSIPLTVLLVVPLGVMGAVLFSLLRGLSADVYFNVGLITIVGLAAKNAMLIVEFALKDEGNGRSIMEATIEGARQRLRPILMTSLAFILGMIPLVLASGPGAASRHAVGTGVMGGMIAATAFGIFFTPLFYVAVRRWLTGDRRRPLDDDPRATDEG